MSYVTLQTLALPEEAVDADPLIYMRADDGVHVSDGRLRMMPGAVAGFDTWMNLLNLTNWQAHCALDGLWLRLDGSGRVALRISDLGTEQTLFRTIVDCDDGPALMDLSSLMSALAEGSNMLVLRLVALTEAELREAAFVTRDTHVREVRLAIGITTFRREAAVAQTVTRLEAFFAGQAGAEGRAVGAATHVFVIDNGQSAEIADSAHVTRIPNVNLGGAGGFARALAAAQAGGFTHSLFMDDDASFGMEALVRTLAFLRLARDPRAALAGAMIASEVPWALWESGATFDTLCRPQFGGTDLRDPGAILLLEQAGSGTKPDGFYGGWWYFAFPVEDLEAHPFPFFVRGDDSSFSLANDFAFATLNGVVSFQDDFGAKETPLVHYLDLRYHLHHPLVHDRLRRGKWGIARVACRMILRQMVRMHYASAAAQLQAWRDVMEGPEFFEANADMANKRAEIGALSAPEAWETGEVPPPAPSVTPPRWKTYLLLATLNGHLIPWFAALGGKARLGLTRRSFLWPYWGKAEVTIVDVKAARSYTVRHSKRRFFALQWEMIRCLWRWNSVYSRLKRDHQAGYKRLASPDWWREVFSKGPRPL